MALFLRGWVVLGVVCCGCLADAAAPGAPAGGPRVETSWPADLASDVPPNLTQAVIHIEAEVRPQPDGLWLVDDRGRRTPAGPEHQDCERFGLSGGTCVVLKPRCSLRPNTRYRLVAAASWLDDERWSPWQAEFRTAREPDRTPPSLRPIRCAPDETPVANACALLTDTSITLRLRASEAVRATLASGSARASVLSSNGEAEPRLASLRPGRRHLLALTLLDAAGNELRTRLAAATPAALARVSITEVRADPRGPEPAQEYVELLNYGETAVDISGFHISDARAQLGDVIPPAAPIAPHSRVLLVARGFDPDDPHDVAPPAGLPLVRLDRALAQGGLANRGEPLYLRDSAGRRLSAAPATPPPRRGVCIFRTAGDMRSGSPGTFAYEEDGACTPGR